MSENFNKDVNNVLYTITKIVFFVFAIFLVLNFFSPYIKSGLESVFPWLVADIDSNKGLNVNINGGLTGAEINNQKNNKDCPQLDDLYDNLHILDLDNIVCFYREVEIDDKTIYPNLIFVKTDNGLVYNGATNIICTRTSYILGIVKTNIKQNYNELPVFYYNSYFTGNWYVDAMTSTVIYDSGNICFCKMDGIPLITGVVSSFNSGKVIEYARDFINTEIYNKYFMSFADNQAVIILDNINEDGSINNEKGYASLNGFYDYIYRSALSVDYGENNKGKCMIDVSKQMMFPIPEKLQHNFPINDTENFKTYNANMFFDVTYEKLNISSPVTPKPGNIKEDISVIDNKVNSSLSVEINIKTDSTLNFITMKNVIKDNPVKISFYNDKNELVRNAIFNYDNYIDINCNTLIALDKGVYSYKINSGQLLFNSYSGKVTINDNCRMTFKYDYQFGLINSMFKISPISTDLNITSVDFASTPVKIILNNLNKDLSYTIVFDDIALINTNIVKLVEIGSYSYSILSDVLVFGSTYGTLDITATNRAFEYKFGLVNHGKISFNVNIDYSTVGGDGSIVVAMNDSSVALLLETFDTNGFNYSIPLSSGLVSSGIHSTALISSGFENIFEYQSSFVDGHSYNIAISFYTSDGQTWSTDTFTFVYHKSAVNYITISCYENI